MRPRPHPRLRSHLLACLGLSSSLFAALHAAPAPAAERSGPDFRSYEGMVTAAGDSHRHAGVAASLPIMLAARGRADRTRCPHEWGDPTAVYEAARRNGLDWLSLSHHTGIPGIVKPDSSPHQLTGSRTDLAYRWWTTPGRPPVESPKKRFTLRPDPRGFADFTADGPVDPPYNEALSLSSAATSATRTEEFAAFSGREFTTASYSPQGGLPGEGGHKVVVLRGDTSTSCGVATKDGEARNCESEMDLYRWTMVEKAAVIQAHPGYPVRIVRFSKRNAQGGFSDRYVHGIEVGKLNNFKPSWELTYQQFLQRGYRLFPAFGSDSHHFDGFEPCTSGRAPQLDYGATVCWVPEIERDAIVDAMRERRCYYSRAYAPQLRFEARDAESGGPAVMGSLLSVPSNRIHLDVEAVNDPRSFEAKSNGRRFERLEILRVTRSGTQVVASCDANGDAGCRCELKPEAGVERCSYSGEVTLRRGAIYARVLEPEGEMLCPDPKMKKCIGHPAAVVGAPIFVNWED